MFRQTRPEWDAPADGAFARSGERLTSAQASAKPSAPVQPQPQEPKAARPPSNAGATAAPPDLAPLWAPFAGALQIVRSVLLVLTLAHGAALFVFGKGSLPGLLFTGGLWWGLGRVAAVVSGLKSPGGGRAPIHIAPPHERLRQLAQQRDTGKKQ